MGMFFRLLLVVLVVVLVWRLVKANLHRLGWRQMRQPQAPSSLPKDATQNSGQQRSNETMVRCDVCDLHLPQSQATLKGSRYVCNDHV
jgi:hypothetical protein